MLPFLVDWITMTRIYRVANMLLFIHKNKKPFHFEEENIALELVIQLNFDYCMMETFLFKCVIEN